MLMLLNVARAASVTLGASVTLNGTFFTDAGIWDPGVNAAPADIVDGVYVPQNQQWNIESVWWNGYSNPANSILVSLTDTFKIDAFKVQADDNDTYLIEYWGLDSAWHTAWAIPAVYTYGLDFRSITLGSAITTNALRFTATGGDGFYSVAEIEAFGKPLDHSVPEGGAASLMLGAALGLLALVRRFQR